MRLKNFILLGAALMLAVPAVTTLPGCGGGNSGVNTQIFNGLPLNLGNGQTATLNLTFTGNALTGTLVVPQPLVLKGAVVGPKAINFTLPPGTYQLTGTFTPPRGFTANGSYQDGNGATVNFTLTGQVPTTSTEGSFTFTALGQSVTGTIPRIGQGTATPTPTATTNSDNISGDITNAFNSNVVATSFNLALQSSTARNTAPRIFTAIYNRTDVAIRRSISLEILPTLDLAVGQSYTLADHTIGSLTYFEADNANPSGTAKNWDSSSGLLTINSIQGDKITFTITNARLQARGTDAATGSFTINATGQARTSFGTG